MRSALSLGCILVALSCGGGERLPADQAWVPVQRLVQAREGLEGRITLGLPSATLRDDTRPVLRAPHRQTLLWPKVLDEEPGNRLLHRRQTVPPGLREAASLLVLPSVKIGPTWLEPPPALKAVKRLGAHPVVTIDFPIPANPDARRVSISAQAYGLGLADLTRLETTELEVPKGARLEFAVGVVEPDWGFDPVEFRIEACEGERCETVFRERYDPAGPDDGHWRDHRVSLAGFGGRRLVLRFGAERLASAAPFSFPVWADPTLYAPAPRGEGRNVILLSVDTLRADHLSPYGYRHDTSPFVAQRFGQGGTVFETLVAAATITTPSHATMFTSLTPVAHGTVDGLKMLPRNLPTLAEWVRHEGRDTAAITENGWLSIRHGFGRGFASFVENRSANIMDPEGQVDRTFAQARDWLTRHRDKRFFLFLHTFQVHTPYAPPPRYDGLFREHESGPIDERSPSHLRWMAEYDREIRYVDDELRRLFETLDELGLGEDTVFILTSDHGEAFLEHGELEHGSRLDEEVVRVPLLLWGRGVAAGRRVAAPAAHLDLMPTILDLMGLPAPGWVQGLSLRPLLAAGAEAPEALASRPLYSESRGTLALGPERAMLPFHPPAFLVRVGDRKLARYRDGNGGHHYEYYDLATDPGERENLYPTRADEARDLFELLESYEARGRDLRARLDGGEDPSGQAVELDPRQEEKLRALGYLR